MSAHTPGPWGVHLKSDMILVVGKRMDGSSELAALPVGSKSDYANACVMAAAPELLAALEALLADVDYAMPHLPLGTIGLRRIRQAREAIAKAEGRT